MGEYDQANRMTSIRNVKLKITSPMAMFSRVIARFMIAQEFFLTEQEFRYFRRMSTDPPQISVDNTGDFSDFLFLQSVRTTKIVVDIS